MLPELKNFQSAFCQTCDNTGREALIEINDVSFAYGDRTVLDGVNLTVMPGEFVSLLGANGSGKSTLLKLLLGELLPQRGTILIMGQTPARFSDWTKIGYVAQNKAASYGGFPATVEEVVLAHLYEKIGRFKLPGKKARAKVMRALEIVEMAEYARQPIGELSGGQQQRVLLARAMINEPEMVLLDEPTTGVDAHNALLHFELLSRLNREQGLTVLVVTHDMAKSAEFVKKSFCLEDGNMVCLCREQLQDELAHRHHHPHQNIQPQD